MTIYSIEKIANVATVFKIDSSEPKFPDPNPELSSDNSFECITNLWVERVEPRRCVSVQLTSSCVSRDWTRPLFPERIQGEGAFGHCPSPDF